jgi:hypothetical protein
MLLQTTIGAGNTCTGSGMAESARGQTPDHTAAGLTRPALLSSCFLTGCVVGTWRPASGSTGSTGRLVGCGLRAHMYCTNKTTC